VHIPGYERKFFFAARKSIAVKMVGQAPIESARVKIDKRETVCKLPADRAFTRTSRTVDGDNRFFVHNRIPCEDAAQIH
jgi:hypothetical protein